MRYLKVTAQDRSGNGKADAVLLHFHNGPDNLVSEAFAVDLSDDGCIDFACACDIDVDGEQNLQGRQLLSTFAEAYLQLGWFNSGNSRERYLKIEARNYHADSTPNVVNLQFTQDDGTQNRPVLIKLASAYDGDNDGHLDSFTNSDINADGIANNADKLLLRKIAEAFLAFRWFQT